MALSKITASSIADGTVVASDIADSTITGAKLASATITGDKIGVGQITANLFAAGAVTATSIYDGTSNVSVTSTNGNVIIGTAGSERVRVDTGGNVGIGTSSTSNARLDVVSTDTSQQYVNVLRLKTTDTGDFHPAILFENNRNGVQNAMKIITDSGSTAGSGFLGFRIANSSGTFVTMGGFNNDGNFQFNSGYGTSAVAYGCRAWVNFNGTGTPAIRASGNVSSITDDGTGLFRVNFSTAMPDTNYSLLMGVQEDVGGGPRFGNGRGTWSSSVAYIESRNLSSTLIDPQYFWVAVFR